MKIPPFRLAPILVLATSFLLLQAKVSQAIIDLDGDQLDDVWEEVYGAQAVLPLADDDGDGHNSLDESAAGTDPFDASSCLAVSSFTLDDDSATVTFPTSVGKNYTVEIANKVGNGFGPWVAQTPPLNGANGNLTINLSNSAIGSACGSIAQSIWINTGGGTDIASLTGDPSFPNSPDGFNVLDRLEITPNHDDNYGGRIIGHVVPPGTGTYTFYLTSRHSAELRLSPDENFFNAVVVATVDSATQDLAQKEWTTFASQAHSVALTAGQKYYIEVRHIHGSEQDHCAVGWSGPGIPSGAPDPGPIQVIDGEHLCPFTGAAIGAASALDGAARKFVRVKCTALDQDGDGLDDWAEAQLSGYNHLKATSTSSGLGDFATVSAAVQATSETVAVSVADNLAIENNTPFAGKDKGLLRITRTGTLQPLTVNVSFPLIGVLTDVDAEPEDYIATDENGDAVGASITLPFGAYSADVVIEAIDDAAPTSGDEYPEVVTLRANPDAAYTVAAAPNHQGLCILYDFPDHPDNNKLFVGIFTQDANATVNTSAGGVASLVVNGPNNHAVCNTNFAGLTSPQNDSHIHKANAGPAGGPILYEITETPGNPGSDPLIGPLTYYPWDIGASGGFTAQEVIDSLFNQNGETQLYINKHTNDNQDGEIWALFVEAQGSIAPPVHDPPPPIEFIDPVAEETQLRREISRFFTQAGFGPQQSDINNMYATILAAPGQDRMAVYEQWIDDQLNQAVTPQTSIMEFTMAMQWQEWDLYGYFDSADNPAAGRRGWEYNNPGTVKRLPAVKPASWPVLDAYNPDTIDYTEPFGTFAPPEPSFPGYPLTNQEIGHYNDVHYLGAGNLGRAWQQNPRRAQWTAMIRGKDQLRQRLAFAWSQIMVISTQFRLLYDRTYGMARYMDMLAENSDDTFREMLEAVTYSPMMGKYLSSLQNQKAIINPNPPFDVLVYPDENYAREIMQLLSIGLPQIHMDGSFALDAVTGLPQATYDNGDIFELSKIMTGFSFGSYSNSKLRWDNPIANSNTTTNNNTLTNNFNRGNGDAWYGASYEYPMRMFGYFHDLTAKTIVGGHVVDNTGLSDGNLGTRNDEIALGRADIADVHDWLAGTGAAPYDGYFTTPPFIARRLIQRLVTSNPTADYVFRVAQTFYDTGGDLKEVTKAILLDYQARSFDAIDERFGRKKPPVYAYIQMLRALQGNTKLPIVDNGAFPAYADTAFIGNYGLSATQANNIELGRMFRWEVTDTTLTMSPMRAETVFNFYLPDYSPSGIVSQNSMFAPEFQILTDTTVMQNLNYFRTIAVSNTANTGESINVLPNQTWTSNGGGSQPGMDGNTENAFINRAGWIAKFNAYPYDASNVEDEDIEIITQLIDELDELLTQGRLKDLYPYDEGDDGAPTTHGALQHYPNRNPREILIHYLADTYSHTATNHDREIVRYAFQMLPSIPEYQVQK